LIFFSFFLPDQSFSDLPQERNDHYDREEVEVAVPDDKRYFADGTLLEAKMKIYAEKSPEKDE